MSLQVSADHGSYGSYLIGFFASIVLSVIPYWIVTGGGFSTEMATVDVVIAAVVQLFVQLVFFMHLNTSSAQRWNVLAFLFTLLIVAVLIVGSLWIMYHLNHNMMETMM